MIWPIDTGRSYSSDSTFPMVALQFQWFKRYFAFWDGLHHHLRFFESIIIRWTPTYVLTHCKIEHHGTFPRSSLCPMFSPSSQAIGCDNFNRSGG